MLDYIENATRLKREGFYPQLLMRPKGWRVTIPTGKLRKIPLGDGLDPATALAAAEADLRELLAVPAWRMP